MNHEKTLLQIADGIIGAIHRNDITINKSSDIRQTIDENPIVEMMELNDADKQKLEQLVGSEVVVVEEKSSAISKDSKPWLNGEREQDITWDYWERFRKHLRVNSGFPHTVLNRLSEDTRSILDLCGDPNVEGNWKRSGLVMGHVQSGKTTNYSGVIARGIDSGYRIFIVFAGITNSLRAQTQERIEEGIVGLSTRTDKTVGVGNIRDLGKPTMWTTVAKDFTISTARGIRSDLNDGSTHIFVLKKNKTTIDSLLSWFKKSHPGKSLTSPLMLIDDEADNASVNTAKDKARVTAINKGIRSLMQRFDRGVYIGYTATPFANIFINHENDEELKKVEQIADDLFPRNFIKSLGAPDNYVGANRMFGDVAKELSLSHTVYDVDDYEDILPLKHKKDHSVETLPLSLLHAVRMFVLFCCIQKIRGNWEKHMSMMINVSRFNDVQERIEELVTDYLEELKNSATMSSGLGKKGLSNKNLSDLKKSYELGFLPDERGFIDTKESGSIDFIQDIMPELHLILNTILPKTINMKKGGLNYSDEHFLKVIAIGGLALSRGLTLEGLSVSYLLRNAGASDTLMQMARWFGYRIGFENLTRLYLPEISRRHYEAVNDSIEELREELRIMEFQEKTPLDFGIKVRNSDTGIRITAANKSRSAAPLSYAKSYEYKNVQGHLLHTEEKMRKQNWKTTMGFLESLEKPQEICSKELPTFSRWKCSGSKILHLLEEFHFPDDHPDLGRKVSPKGLLFDYIEDRVSNELATWDVILPLRGSEKSDEKLAEISGHLKLTRRHSCSNRLGAEASKTFHTTEKNAVANPGDFLLGLDEEEFKRRGNLEKEKGSHRFTTRLASELRGRPLMLVHLMHCKPGAAKNIEGFGAEPRHFASLSFILPGTSVQPISRIYTANSVLQLLGEIDEEIDDDYEAIISEGA